MIINQILLKIIRLLKISLILILYFFDCSRVEAGTLNSLLILKQSNHVALMRHTLAPGFGDPDNFELHNCDTQRNLSTEGVIQAQKVGKLLKSIGILTASVHSSQWCRCVDTANNLNLGPISVLPPLNSFFQNLRHEKKQTNAIIDWINNQKLDKPTILVTHQVNITALTGVYPSSGEIVVVKRIRNRSLKLVGTFNQ
jgi:8-oxo-(d)GTP phosphatase